MDDHKLKPFNRSQKTNALDVLLSCTRFFLSYFVFQLTHWYRVRSENRAQNRKKRRISMVIDPLRWITGLQQPLNFKFFIERNFRDFKFKLHRFAS